MKGVGNRNGKAFSSGAMHFSFSMFDLLQFAVFTAKLQQMAAANTAVNLATANAANSLHTKCGK